MVVPAHAVGGSDLWKRLASVLGVDPAVADPSHPHLRRNRSLGQREAQLLRRMNQLVERQVPWPVWGEAMVHLAEQVFGRTPDPIVLPARQPGWVARCSVEMVGALRGPETSGRAGRGRRDAGAPPQQRSSTVRTPVSSKWRLRAAQ